VERFRFSLQKVLELRSHRERGSRREMAAALAEVQRLESLAAGLQKDLATCRDEGAGVGSGTGLAAALESGFQRRLEGLQRQRRAAERRLATAQETFRQRRMELRSMERLREARHGEWRDRVMRAEQNELDELARLRSFSGSMISEEDRR